MNELFKMDDIKVGQKVSGEVIELKDNVALIDLHQFAEGTIYVNEFGRGVSSFKGILNVGDTVEAIVKKIDEEHGKILLSRLPLLVQQDNEEMKGLSTEKKIISLKIEKNVGRGVIGHYLGNEVYVDYKQLDLEEVTKEKADEFVGKTIEVKLFGFEPERRHYNASRKDILVAARKEAKEKEFATFVVGNTYTGVVAKIDEHLGVFVKFEFNQGLIRYRELSHIPFTKMEDVVKVGEAVEVKLLNIDEKNRLDFSRKALLKTPYEEYAEAHKVSDVVEGKVVQKNAFGAIVEVAPNVTALLHKEEISWNPNDNTFASFKIGSPVSAAIINIDAKRRRVGLSMKVLVDNPWAKVTCQVGEKATVTVSEIVAGRYLKVNAFGVDGIINLRDVPMKEKSSKLEDYYSAGDQVDAIVTFVDAKAWKLELSIKKLTDRIEREQFEQYMEAAKTEEEAITLGDRFKDLLK